MSKGQEWIRLPIKYLKDKKLSPTDCVVLAVLIDKCEEQEEELSMQELADCCGVSLRTVKAAVATLVDKGLIGKQNTRGYASRYTAAGILPPKRRTSKQAALDMELKNLKKQAEVKRLKEQLEEEKDIEKYNCVINKL